MYIQALKMPCCENWSSFYNIIYFPASINLADSIWTVA